MQIVRRAVYRTGEKAALAGQRFESDPGPAEHTQRAAVADKQAGQIWALAAPGAAGFEIGCQCAGLKHRAVGGNQFQRQHRMHIRRQALAYGAADGRYRTREGRIYGGAHTCAPQKVVQLLPGDPSFDHHDIVAAVGVVDAAQGRDIQHRRALILNQIAAAVGHTAGAHFDTEAAIGGGAHERGDFSVTPWLQYRHRCVRGAKKHIVGIECPQCRIGIDTLVQLSLQQRQMEFLQRFRHGRRPALSTGAAAVCRRRCAADSR